MAKFNDVTVGQMEACINRLGGMQQFLDFIGGKGQIMWQTVYRIYSVIVDYNQSLNKMILAGKYDLVNQEITEKNFPSKLSGSVPLNFELFHFNRLISSESAVAELDKMGFRPATVRELLSFGAKYPEMQREFPVVALGEVSEIDGNRRVAGLGRDVSGRGLGLDWWSVDWIGRCRFLAVRK